MIHSQSLGWAPGTYLKIGKRDDISKGIKIMMKKTTESWPDLVKFADSGLTTEDPVWSQMKPAECRWQFCDLICVRWGLAVRPGLILGKSTVFSSLFPMVGYFSQPWYRGECLGPASTWYTRLFWLPKGGLASLRSEWREGRGEIGVGERKAWGTGTSM